MKKSYIFLLILLLLLLKNSKCDISLKNKCGQKISYISSSYGDHDPEDWKELDKDKQTSIKRKDSNGYSLCLKIHKDDAPKCYLVQNGWNVEYNQYYTLYYDIVKQPPFLDSYNKF
ncbi:expressed protein [Dictyostelium purpureum]|uniref:Expressed protein n=1 Tax=Dictyostelium purpureum TaxID=5786 RepID=F0ZXS3_DICPU|nr:uncharacterized protein DICPUDRAFT_99263 [Dictyostelium purpureum]EGC31263.1 expressed protein [Dictyostelium purpureum]|eukprot:XP_003292208.1 expressed protein [Dictyostelium purpureum]